MKLCFEQRYGMKAPYIIRLESGRVLKDDWLGPGAAFAGRRDNGVRRQSGSSARKKPPLILPSVEDRGNGAQILQNKRNETNDDLLNSILVCSVMHCAYLTRHRNELEFEAAFAS